MRTKSTPVRLVSKKQYRRVMRKRVGAYLTAFGAACFGIICIVAGVIFMSPMNWRYHASETAPVVWFFGGLGVLGIWCGKLLLRDARKIERVALLTTQNAKYAPDEKILVRGSERPHADAQAELLRPMPTGADAPAEQLLRAAQADTTE